MVHGANCVSKTERGQHLTPFGIELFDSDTEIFLRCSEGDEVSHAVEFCKLRGFRSLRARCLNAAMYLLEVRCLSLMDQRVLPLMSYAM